MYDRPYRVEKTNVRRPDGTYDNGFEIACTGLGVIATGENYMDARRLVELANEAAAIEQGHRGR